MDRRTFLEAGAAIPMAALPFRNGSVKGIPMFPDKTTKYCEICGKEVCWREVMLAETTAMNHKQRDRTYVAIGMFIFHMDGTRCSKETMKLTRLEDPIIHTEESE